MPRTKPVCGTVKTPLNPTVPLREDQICIVKAKVTPTMDPAAMEKFKRSKLQFRVNYVAACNAQRKVIILDESWEQERFKRKKLEQERTNTYKNKKGFIVDKAARKPVINITSTANTPKSLLKNNMLRPTIITSKKHAITDTNISQTAITSTAVKPTNDNSATNDTNAKPEEPEFVAPVIRRKVPGKPRLGTQPWNKSPN